MSNRDEKEKIEEISTSFTTEEKGKWKAETSREELVSSTSNQLATGTSQQISALTPEQKLTLTQVEEAIDLFFHKDKHPEYGSFKELLSKLEGCELINKTYKLITVVPCAFCKQDSFEKEIIPDGIMGKLFFSSPHKTYFLKKEDLEVPICRKCRLLGNEEVLEYFYRGEDRGMVPELVSVFSFDVFHKKLLERKDNEIFGSALEQQKQLKKTAWKVYDFAHVFQEIGVKNESLVEKNNQLQKEVEESQAKEESLADDLFETKRKGEDLLIDRNNRIVQLSSEVARLKNLLSEQHDEFQKIVSGPDSGKLVGSIAKDQAIKTLTLELEDCKSQLEIALQRNIYIDGYQKDIKYLRDRVERLKKERDDWKIEVDRKEAEIIKNTEYFQKAKEEIADLEKVIEGLKKKVEEWKKKYSDESILRSANIEKSNNALLAMKKEKEDLEKKISSEWWNTQHANFSGGLITLSVAASKRVPFIPASWHQTIETVATYEKYRQAFAGGSFLIIFIIFALFYETIRWLYWRMMDRIYEKKVSVSTSNNNDISLEREIMIRRILADHDSSKRTNEKKTKKIVL